jgi:hypothetical protein
MRHARPSPSESPSPRFLELVAMGGRDLEQLLLRGQTPEPEELAGWQFRGANSMKWASLARIKKFIKGFYLEGDGGLRGYNCPVAQDRLDRPWRARPDHDRPRRFGFYTVEPVDATRRDNAYLHAVLLDYGRGDNPRLDPSRGIRDYLVRVDDEPDIFLGKAYYAVGPARVPVGYFVLERLREAAGGSRSA